MKTQSRGALYFHRLFSVAELGLGASSAEPHTNRLIREFLKIGEAVAGRWIEMPKGILILQMVADRPDTGAIYLYDRTEQVFHMIGFDGADDNLTIEEFNQLLEEYSLLKFAEHPGLIKSHSAQIVACPPAPQPPMAADRQAFQMTIAIPEIMPPRPSIKPRMRPASGQLWLQSPGSA